MRKPGIDYSKRTPRMWLNDMGTGGRVFCRVRSASKEALIKWSKERRLFSLSGLYLLNINRLPLKRYRAEIAAGSLFVHTGTKTE